MKELEAYKISKINDVLSIVDLSFTALAVVELQDILDKTDTLRENILLLNTFKHFFKSSGKPDRSFSSERCKE